jgi:glycosyltransferase involved in cell wall biosynthesis
MNGLAPIVSVVMPVYNSERFLLAAIDSVLAQSWKHLELLLVDDASTDRSWETIESYSEPRIRCWRLRVNSGPAFTRNRCLCEASGKYVAFIDSDDIAAPTLIEEEVRFLESHAEFQLVAANRENIDENGKSLGFFPLEECSSDRLAADMLFLNRLPTTTLMVRRTLLGDERFDPGIPIASDYEMWTRLTEKGAGCILPQTLAKYRVHPENITHRKRAVADSSLREIMRRQTTRLGINPSEEELTIHLQIPHLTIGTSKETVILAEGWLQKLAEANVRSKKHPQSTFRQMIVDRWYGVCHSACEHGNWTWQRFNRSPICRLSSISVQKKTRLCYLLARSQFKRAFPRLASQMKAKVG